VSGFSQTTTNRLSHREQACLLVDVLPAQREQLATPKAREDRQPHHRSRRSPETGNEPLRPGHVLRVLYNAGDAIQTRGTRNPSQARPRRTVSVVFLRLLTTLTVRLRRPCGARTAIITTVAARMVALAIQGFMVEHTTLRSLSPLVGADGAQLTARFQPRRPMIAPSAANQVRRQSSNVKRGRATN
jgi:hypothetical protein